MCVILGISYIFLFPLLGVIPSVSTVLHLLITYDDFNRHLTNCDKNYKFSVYPYNMLQEFIIDSEVIVTSHPEIVRKSHGVHMFP